jgi:hypothetical protein
MIRVPKIVVDWCDSHKCCKNCDFNCTAPSQDGKYNEWIKNQVDFIESVLIQKSLEKGNNDIKPANKL